MTKVQHRIEQLTKRHAALADSLTALAVEYSEGESAHEEKLKAAKSRIKSGRLSESEERYYRQLSIGLKTENPLAVLLRLFLIEQEKYGNPSYGIGQALSADEEGLRYRVLSSDRETWHEIDSELSSCTCPRFVVKHNCPHLEAVRLLTKLKYKSSVDATFGVQKKGESV